jgi:AraC-like DNA-binding protein
MGLHQIASELGISHKHLINVIQHEFGNHPSYFYDFRIIKITKEILLKEDISIAEVARKFTYDPSNFSKFSKAGQVRHPEAFAKTKTKPKLPDN